MQQQPVTQDVYSFGKSAESFPAEQWDAERDILLRIGFTQTNDNNEDSSSSSEVISEPPLLSRATQPLSANQLPEHDFTAREYGERELLRPEDASLLSGELEFDLRRLLSAPNWRTQLLLRGYIRDDSPVREGARFCAFELNLSRALFLVVSERNGTRSFALVSPL